MRKLQNKSLSAYLRLRTRPRLLMVAVVATSLAMVGAITILAAPSTTVDGTIAFDQAWYTTGGVGAGSLVTVTVNDADVNVNVAASTSISLNLDALETVGKTLPLDPGQEIVGTPVVLQAGQSCPDGTVVPNLAVSVFNASAGSIFVQAFDATGAITRNVCYEVAQKDTLNVGIWSTQTGEVNKRTLVATETEVEAIVARKQDFVGLDDKIITVVT